MTNQTDSYDVARGRAAAMNLGPNADVPAEELAREAAVAGVINPGTTDEVSPGQEATNRDRAEAISPGASPDLSQAELERERLAAERMNLGPQH